MPRASARDVLGDRRPGRHVRALADGHRRDELRVAADEDVVLDHRRVLPNPVVIAGNRAGADVHLLADRRVAQVGQVVGLRPAPEPRLLQLDEVADARARANLRVRADVRERADDARPLQYASPPPGSGRAPSRRRRAPNPRCARREWMTARAPIRRPPWSDTFGRITVSGPTVDAPVHVRRRRVLERDAGRHQRRAPAPATPAALIAASSARLLMPRISSGAIDRPAPTPCGPRGGRSPPGRAGRTPAARCRTPPGAARETAARGRTRRCRS